MEITFDKLKVYIPAIITVISTIVTGVFVAKDYLTDTFVSREEFKSSRELTFRHVLENKKLLLENRIYFLNMCKITEYCVYKSTVDVEIEQANRELSDIREVLNTTRKKNLE